MFNFFFGHFRIQSNVKSVYNKRSIKVKQTKKFVILQLIYFYIFQRAVIPTRQIKLVFHFGRRQKQRAPPQKNLSKKLRLKSSLLSPSKKNLKILLSIQKGEKKGIRLLYKEKTTLISKGLYLP